MSLLPRTFARFINEHRLVHNGQSIVAAVSGGVDSVVMFRLFEDMRHSMNFRLTVAHVNHQLRGEESDADEAFVHKLAEQYHIPCFSTRVDTIGCAHEERLSKQVAARNLRYQFLEEVRKRAKADLIATAHQANDNAETVLLNMLRGTGLRGLAGIPKKRGNIIRPLLFAYRKQIEEFAHQESIQFRNDSSNSALSYKRNALRHKIIPELEKVLGKTMLKTLNEISATMSDVSSVLDELLTKKLGGILRMNSSVEVNIPVLRLQQPFLQREILLELLRRLGVEQTSTKVASLTKLCNGSTGGSLNLGNQCTIFRDRDRLVVLRDDRKHFRRSIVKVGRTYAFPTFTLTLSKPEALSPKVGFRKHAELVDAEKLGRTLVLRPWNEGDWFVPLGLGHRKKLSDFFVDEKVPVYTKSTIPVLEAHGDIVWVCGKRLDDRFKVTDRTKSVVYLTYSPAIQ